MSIFNINSNTGAMNAYNALAKVNKETFKAQLRLATQKRINTVADDTSGYNVGKSLEGKVSQMKAAQGNISAAKDFLSTAEAALQNVGDLLNQIKAKIADATDPTKSESSLASDIEALGSEISNIMSRTEFNGTTLLSGTKFSAGFKFQTGVNTGEDITLAYTTSLGTLDLSGVTSVTSPSTVDVSSLVTSVTNALGSIGNDIQRLDIQDSYTTAALSNANSSISRLFDADMALEQMNATKGSIAQNIGISMLAQLNTAPQAVLSLFR
ncbi:MAG: flagellin [bacterium]